jgi:lipopolysaccharide export system permease protein
MIFHRALYRELTTAFLGVATVLLGITVSILVVRFLGEAASGSLASEAVASFLGFHVLNYLPVLLSLSLFIAVLMTLTRSYRDSEMVVWFASGLSVAAWVKPVARFAAPIVVAIALLSLILSPWALSQSEEYRRQLDSRDDVSAVSPGVFKESKQSDRVYFVESFAGSSDRVSNIFMQMIQHQKLGVMVARQGQSELAKNGDRFMVLESGRRYEGEAGSPEYRIMEFQNYAVRIEPYEAKFIEPSVKSRSTLALVRQLDPNNMAELQWRLSLPIAALVLAMLAIPLSFVNPRAGRSLNLMFAILAYMIYSNLMSIAQAWVAQSKLAPSIGLWAVHAVMIVLMLSLFYRRLRLSPLLLFRRLKPWRR